MFDFDLNTIAVMIIAALVFGFIAGRISRRGNTHFNCIISEELMSAKQKAAYTTVRALYTLRRDFGPGADLTAHWLEHKFTLPAGYNENALMTTVDALIARIEKQFKLGDMPAPALEPATV